MKLIIFIIIKKKLFYFRDITIKYHATYRILKSYRKANKRMAKANSFGTNYENFGSFGSQHKRMPSVEGGKIPLKGGGRGESRSNSESGPGSF